MCEEFFPDAGHESKIVSESDVAQGYQYQSMKSTIDHQVIQIDFKGSI